MMAAIKNITSFLYANKFLLYLVCIAVILILSTFFKGRKVTLKKRKSIYRLRPLRGFSTVIDRIPFLYKIRDNLTIDLAIITKKDKNYNKLYAERLLSIIIIVFFLSLILSVLILKFLILIVFVPIIVLVLSIIILLKIIDIKRKKLKSDIPEVIVIFTSKFASTMNILRSLQASMNFIPDSHKFEFGRLISAMASSIDYVTALDEYKKRIDDPFCDDFVELLKTNYIRNENILQGLIELQDHIAAKKKLELNRHNEVYEQKLNLYLGILFVVFGMCLVIWLLDNYAIDFYFESFEGQLLTTATFVWILISLIIVAISERL